MLEWTYNLLSKNKIAIDPKYEKLILSLKTAYANEFDLKKLCYILIILTPYVYYWNELNSRIIIN